MRRFILCHYHEIALKKKNRVYFENLLCSNMERALQGVEYRSIQRLYGRLAIGVDDGPAVADAVERLKDVFGIANYSPAWCVAADLEEMSRALRKLLPGREFKTFKIHTRRATKKFPVDSPEINRRLGDVVRREMGKSVDLDNPDLTCYVHVINQDAFIYFDRLRGAGGLPVSSAGKVVVLISGGIDSPVAAYKIMRRGCRAIFVHFHSYPHTSLESQEKVRKLVRLLSRYQYRSTLHLVPFAEAQRQVVALTPPETRVILYRRLMLRAAQSIARRERARALITGDSIGQVASQTLKNIDVISRVAELPVLRPLIGEDKEEIIQQARELGTYPISILPDQDCCSLFIPRHPETRASLRAVENAERELNIRAILQDLSRRMETESIEFEFTPEDEASRYQEMTN